MSKPVPTADLDGDAAPVLSFSPVVLPVPGRPVDLRLRVSAPVTGSELPIIVLAHGHGPSNYVSSLYGYAPLANYYAANGFVVLQPTFLDSATLGLREAQVSEAPLYWRSRAQDVTRVIDQLDAVEAAVPSLRGRLDRTRIAVVGHSMGGHTAGLLLGARLNDPADGSIVDLSDPRITAGVLMSAPGRGGDAISENAAKNYPAFKTTDFSRMTPPVLVMFGDNDNDETQHLTVMGSQWYTGPYLLSPGPKSLVTLFGAEHGLGGVAGYDLAETTDENPQWVAAVQRLSWAYLRSHLYPGDPAWSRAAEALVTDDGPIGRLESK